MSGECKRQKAKGKPGLAWLTLAFYFSFLTLNCSAADLTPAQIEFFENKIRPVLAKECYKCHSASAEKVRG